MVRLGKLWQTGLVVPAMKRPKVGFHTSPARIPRKREQGWVIDQRAAQGLKARHHYGIGPSALALLVDRPPRPAVGAGIKPGRWPCGLVLNRDVGPVDWYKTGPLALWAFPQNYTIAQYCSSLSASVAPCENQSLHRQAPQQGIQRLGHSLAVFHIRLAAEDEA